MILFCDHCESDSYDIIKEEGDVLISKCLDCGKETEHCKPCVEAANEAFSGLAESLILPLFESLNIEDIDAMVEEIEKMRLEGEKGNG